MKAMNLARRLLLVAGLAVVAGAAWLAPLDSSASGYAQAGLKRALVTFATARALNAVISVVQGTEVAVEPAGVGVVFTPGQVLDPVNDLVEQFSALMLTASVAFGVQLALIKFGGYWAVSLALTALAIAWGWASWRAWTAPAWLTRLFVGLLLVRFAVPVVVLGSEAGFRLFLEKDYAQGQQSIELSSAKLASLSPPTPMPKADATWSERIRQWWTEQSSVGQRFDELKEVAGRAVEHIVTLIVVFLLQTLVVPLLLFWGLLRLARVVVALPGAGTWRAP
jgi:hypothetical protein